MHPITSLHETFSVAEFGKDYLGKDLVRWQSVSQLVDLLQCMDPSQTRNVDEISSVTNVLRRLSLVGQLRNFVQTCQSGKCPSFEVDVKPSCAF